MVKFVYKGFNMNVLMKNSEIATLSYKGLHYERYPTHDLMTWDEATLYLNDLNKNSSTTWRFGSVNELEKLSTQTNKNFFKNLEIVWSKDQEDADNIWVMDFQQSLYCVRNKNMRFRVLCVKDTSLKRSIKFF